MPRYIDADYLLGTYQAVCSAISCEECRAKYKDGTCKVEHWLKAQPTIDAVEVVRCKDCKWGDRHGTTDEGKPYYYCVITDWAGQPPEFFCANGERRRK